MSTITPYPPNKSSSVQVIWSEAKVATPTRDQAHHSDAEMMYAWSIGVTEAAHEMAETRRDEKECPPEVYIG